MPKPSEYDKTHLRNMAAIETRIDRIFKKAAEEAAKIGVSIKTALPDDRIFSFDDYPATRQQIERLMTALQQSMETTIVNGVQSAWTLSNNKNNALAQRIFGDRVGKLSKEQYRRYFSNNGEALEAFLERKTQGLNLSDRVWRYTDAFRHEIELGLDLGIRTGESAAQMTRSLRQYLQHPDKLFRRVRDQHGHLKLSQAAKAFHPGRGVYRSSYKNARRLAATETNIAYRTSDHLRWQQMDFVVGIEIKLSNNHTLNGSPLTDICDTLAGKYPKDFKFTGWHPLCRCHVVSVLKTEEEMAEDTQRILNGEQPTKSSANTVREVPSAFKAWVEANAARIRNVKSLPYFLSDNTAIVRPLLSMEQTINIGDKEWTVRDLITECKVEATTNGKIYVHPAHGKNELAENLEFARWRAEQFGEEVILLPNPQRVKSADSYNITRGVMEEFKTGRTPSVNAFDLLLRNGAKQADYIILEIDCDASPITIANALNDRMKRTSIAEIRLKVGNAEAIYKRECVIQDGFKIKLEDFHSVSASQSRGAGLTSKEAVSITDTKLAKFFGVSKKSPLEIAAERHAQRTQVTKQGIQHAWNERRLSRLSEAISAGYLPDDCKAAIKELQHLQMPKQLDVFNRRVTVLQQAANRHAQRTPADIKAIQDRWNAKLDQDHKTRLVAKNVFKLRSEYPLDVDFSGLENLISTDNLTKMRGETRKVAQAIKTVRAEEKALSKQLDNVHEWHKKFSITELKQVAVAIESKLAKWESQGISFDLNAEKLKSKLEFEIQWLEKNKKHSTWQVAQGAYKKTLKEIDNQIELGKLYSLFDDLDGFKTTSKDFKHYMTKAQEALDAGDATTAKGFLSIAQSKKNVLEHKRKGKIAFPTGSKSGGVKFDASEFTQKKKEEALWFGGKLGYDDRQDGWDEADKFMHPLARQNWLSWNPNQREVGYLYTSGSRYINEPLFSTYHGTKLGINGTERNCWKDINTLTDMIDKAVPLPKGMWVQHGEDMGAFSARFGIDLNYAGRRRKSLIGKTAANKPFTSCGCAKYSGFADYEVVMNIYCPAGTKGIYAEPFSHYGDGGYGRSAYNWEGQSRQAEGYSSSYENEIILQRGSIFRITKIEFNSSEEKWYVDCELIEQPTKTDNVI